MALRNSVDANGQYAQYATAPDGKENHSYVTVRGACNVDEVKFQEYTLHVHIK